MQALFTTYKDRLINLSSRNRSLVLRKLYKKRSLDMAKAMSFGGFGPLQWDNFLLERESKSFMICGDPIDTKREQLKQLEKQEQIASKEEWIKKIETQNESMLAFFNQINYLQREIDFIEKETGKYELFVGYPFVEGKFKEGTFVRAPLLLFPVTLEKKAGKWWMSHLKEQDILLNKVFLFAHAKYNNMPLIEIPMEYASLKELLPEAVQSTEGTQPVDVPQPHPVSLLIEQLAAQKIKIEGTLDPIALFKDMTNETMPPYEAGQLVLKNHSILGQFPLSNAIYTDYQMIEKLLEDDQTLTLEGSPLSGLVLNQGKKAATTLQNQQEEVKEHARHFISDLDHSQEMAISALQYTDQLVIYGPPGTGKSQTIGNIISDGLAKGQKILMVSQKRAALDVIYNRLSGIHSKLTIIHDSQKDKSAFYAKVAEQLTEAKLSYEQNSKIQIDELSTKIENDLKLLEEMGRFLNKTHSCGLSLMTMYAKTKGIHSKEDPRFQNFVTFSANNPLQTLTYKELAQSVSDIQKQPQCIEAQWQIITMKQSHPLIDSFTHGLTFIEQEQYKQAIQKAITFIQTLPACEPIFLEQLKPLYTKGVPTPTEIQTLAENYTHQRYGTLLKQDPIPWWNILEQLNKSNRLKQYEINATQYESHKATHEASFKVAAEYATAVITTLQPMLGAMTQSANDSIYQLLWSGARDITLFQQLLEATTHNPSYTKWLSIHLNGTALQQTFLKNAYENTLNKDLRGSEDTDQINRMTHYMTQVLELILLDHIETIQKTPEFTAFSQLFAAYPERIDAVDQNCTEKSQWVPQAIESFWNDHFQVYKDSSDFKEFKRQAEKKRQLWPIRKYIQYFPELVFNLLPCWLLSPETVSELLPLEFQFFDLIIFDEASQIFVENALPTLFRGKKVVIAGDDKQLRPTSIFSTKLDESEEEILDVETAAAYEEESLLDLAKINYSAVSLNYHYRARSEELIHFSNYAFYDARLNIAPNTQYFKNTQTTPIEWIKVEGQWIERKNRQEATRVVELIAELLLHRKHNETMGVITFNITQKDLIEDLLEARCQYDSDFKKLYMNEVNRKIGNEDVSLFVKNIENVQGDERDIIIFSVGYAPNEQGKVSIHFGSLSQEGGENRLNVAISRAKQKTYVVSSIMPEQLKVDETKNRGAKLFKNFLQYAKAISDRDEQVSMTILKSFVPKKESTIVQEDLFVEELYTELQSRGFQIHKDLGGSEYRIDLAIMDPVSQKFVLGIECDTRMYVKCPTVRERDLHRKRFLESRGWNIIRLFAMEWWQSKEQVIQKIEHLMETVRRIDAPVIAIKEQSSNQETLTPSSLIPVTYPEGQINYGDHVIVRDCLTNETFDIYLEAHLAENTVLNQFKQNLLGRRIKERFIYESFEYIIFDIVDKI